MDLAIQMHQKAIAHHALKNINLIFSSTWNGRIEPQIHLEFDTASVNVVIDELWESELELDRDMKEECVCAAGDVWGEYRPTVDTAQLCKDAEELCAQLYLRYSAAAVSYSLCRWSCWGKMNVVCAPWHVGAMRWDQVCSGLEKPWRFLWPCCHGMGLAISCQWETGTGSSLQILQRKRFSCTLSLVFFAACII